MPDLTVENHSLCSAWKKCEKRSCLVLLLQQAKWLNDMKTRQERQTRCQNTVIPTEYIALMKMNCICWWLDLQIDIHHTLGLTLCIFYTEIILGCQQLITSWCLWALFLNNWPFSFWQSVWTDWTAVWNGMWFGLNLACATWLKKLTCHANWPSPICGRDRKEEDDVGMIHGVCACVRWFVLEALCTRSVCESPVPCCWSDNLCWNRWNAWCMWNFWCVCVCACGMCVHMHVSVFVLTCTLVWGEFWRHQL